MVHIRDHIPDLLSKLEMHRLSVALNMPEKYREKCGEQRAGSRKQRAESKGRCPPGDKTHLAGAGGHRPISTGWTIPRKVDCLYTMGTRYTQGGQVPTRLNVQYINAK